MAGARRELTISMRDGEKLSLEQIRVFWEVTRQLPLVAHLFELTACWKVKVQGLCWLTISKLQHCRFPRSACLSERVFHGFWMPGDHG